MPNFRPKTNTVAMAFGFKIRRRLADFSEAELNDVSKMGREGRRAAEKISRKRTKHETTKSDGHANPIMATANFPCDDMGTPMGLLA
jgi:hypothetical protein